MYLFCFQPEIPFISTFFTTFQFISLSRPLIKGEGELFFFSLLYQKKILELWIFLCVLNLVDGWTGLEKD